MAMTAQPPSPIGGQPVPRATPTWTILLFLFGITGANIDGTYGDTDGLLSAVSYPATPTLNVGITYDGYDRSTTITDRRATCTASYADLDDFAFPLWNYRSEHRRDLWRHRRPPFRRLLSRHPH